MEFKQIIEKIEETKKVANMTPELNTKKYNTQVGKIRRAQEDLRILFEEYKKQVFSKIVFILPTGSGAKKFTELAQDQLFSISSKDMFSKTTDRMNPILYTNTKFNVSTLETAMAYFREVADEVGILDYPEVNFLSKYTKDLKNKQDLDESLKNIISEQVGSEIIAYYTIHKVSEMALQEKFSGKAVPVLIESDNPEFTQQLIKSFKHITPNVFPIETPEDVTEKNVVDSLKKIKKLVVS